MDSRVKSFVADKLGQRSKELGDQVRVTAGNLRVVADQLRTDPLTRGAADSVIVGAAKIEGFGRYLCDTDVDALVGDAQKFVRERPWLIALGGLALGLSASRVVKAGAAYRDLRPAQAVTAQPLPTAEVSASANRDPDDVLATG